MLGGEHQHQGGAVPQHQQVGGSKEHAKVGPPAIHVGEHRAQARGEAEPAAPAEHPGVGSQGVAEEARGAGGIQALAVRSVRLPFTLREVLLLAAAAVLGGEKGPAVGGEMKRWAQAT